MKIVHVLPALKKGGAERVAVELANHAARAGHQVTVIAAYPVDFALLRDDLHADVQVNYVSEKVKSALWKYFDLFAWIWRHREWLAGNQVLHCHLSYAFIFGMLVHRWRSLTGAKYPVVVQTNHSVGAPISPFYRWLIARAYAECDIVALIAEDDYSRLYSSKHPAIITQVILNGITNTNYKPISFEKKLAYRREIGIPDRCKLVVGAVGRLEEDRKPWDLLKVFVGIAREFGTDVHFILAGGGSELDKMRSSVIEQGLGEQIHFLGQVLEPRLPLAVMNLYISSNVGSMTGLAGMEAALSGLPVLAIQWTSGYRSPTNDWIWSSNDPSEVAKRACELLRQPIACKILADRQKAYVELHHSTEAMATSYYALYQAAAERLQAKAFGSI